MARYGMDGTLRARPGKGPALLELMLEAANLMSTVPGNEIYIVGTEANDADAVRVVEVWVSEAAHDESLTVPGVRELIAKALPLLSGTPSGTVWTPAGGRGLRS